MLMMQFLAAGDLPPSPGGEGEEPGLIAWT